MRLHTLLFGVGLIAGLVVSTAFAGNVTLPRFPALSPDGQRLVFSWRGDLWAAPAQGGQAVRLTSHPAEEQRAAFSPDGRRIAFESTRLGGRNLFVMNADGTDVTPLTHTDRFLTLGDFATLDGQDVVTFDARLEPDAYRDLRPYYVPAEGGPVRRLHDAFGRSPVLDSAGEVVLFERGGSSWLRRHRRHPDCRDVWTYDRTTNTFEQLTDFAGNDGFASFAGQDVIFLSDREDRTVNVYRMKPDGHVVRLTQFTDRDVEHLDVSADGSRAVLARWDRLYTLDLNAAVPEATPLTLTAPEDALDDMSVVNVADKTSEAALSPDGGAMAYVAYGQVFVRGTGQNDPPRRVTQGHSRRRDVAWSAAGDRLYYVDDASGREQIYAATVTLTRGEVKALFAPAPEAPTTQPTTQPTTLATTGPATGPTTGPTTEPAEGEGDGDGEAKSEKPEFGKRFAEALRFEVRPAVVHPAGATMPDESPDGTKLAWRRGNGDLVVRDLATGDDLTLLSSWSTGLEWAWSPDSRLIAYVTDDANFNSDIFVIPADNSAQAVNITRHPDNDSEPNWSKDGRTITFLSERANDEYDVWAIYLDEDLETYTAAELDAYHEELAKQVKKRKPPEARTTVGEPTTRPTTQPATRPADEGDGPDATAKLLSELELETAYLRARRLTREPGSESDLVMLPDGSAVVFVGNVDDDRGLYLAERDGKAPRKLGPVMDLQHLSLKGDKLVGIRGGVVNVIELPGGKTEAMPLKDTLRIDLAEQSRQKFLEAARILEDNFYHPEMKGLDWQALTASYLPLAQAARTSGEFEWVANRLLGELNASHLGVNERDEENPVAVGVGHLGVMARPVDGGHEVVKVIAGGPVSRGPMRLQAGDVIRAVGFAPVRHDLAESLADTVGREVVVTIDRPGTGELHVLATPVSYGQLETLAYEAWRTETAQQVAQMSDGRLGYIHIRSMGQAALDVFERDLFAAADGKAGLIIDVRNNGGGWTTDRLLASIMYPRHAYTVPRGMAAANTGAYPQDRLFIQRYDLPITMLCNEKSFSNAEIISHAFKTLGRGTLVGQETAGGVISTGGTRLVDGTTVRIPFRGWYLPDGTDMENNGAKPDIVVKQTPEDEAAGEDKQLEAAVKELLGRL